ncbi:MAG: hypothetical protein JWP35_4470 [Caulobacter sp.]|nr:hypothetical protein [Caulobacter sp.]
MTHASTEGSPRRKARVAGLLYLGVIAAGAFAFPVMSRVTVRGDAAATAVNILGSEGLYRAAMAADLAGGLLYVGVIALLYELLKPAGRSLSLAAAFFGVAGCTLGAVASLLRLGPLILLQGGSGFSAAAFASLKFHTQAHAIAMTFFGVYCLLLGVAIFRSGFLPRLLGVLVALAGVAWLTSSFGGFLAPALVRPLYPYILAPGFLGEISLTVWLLLVGLDQPKWMARAEAAAS